MDYTPLIYGFVAGITVFVGVAMLYVFRGGLRRRLWVRCRPSQAASLPTLRWR
jgi:hypothetical protein